MSLKNYVSFAAYINNFVGQEKVTKLEILVIGNICRGKVTKILQGGEIFP